MTYPSWFLRCCSGWCWRSGPCLSWLAVSRWPSPCLLCPFPSCRSWSFRWGRLRCRSSGSKFGVTFLISALNSNLTCLYEIMQVCLLCQSPAPSSGRLSFQRWSGTSLGPTERPRWLETQQYSVLLSFGGTLSQETLLKSAVNRDFNQMYFEFPAQTSDFTLRSVRSLQIFPCRAVILAARRPRTE